MLIDASKLCFMEDSSIPRTKLLEETSANLVRNMGFASSVMLGFKSTSERDAIDAEDFDEDAD